MAGKYEFWLYDAFGGYEVYNDIESIPLPFTVVDKREWGLTIIFICQIVTE